MTTTEIQPTTLDGLATRINEEHRACEQAARSAVERAIRVGELLAEAKAQVGHGGWYAWLEANCTIQKRQAQRYMLLARERDLVEEGLNAASGTHLTLKSALRAVHPQANPTRPEEPQDIATNALTAGVRSIAKADMADAVSKYVSEELRPANGRKRGVYVHPDDRQWRIALGPTAAGMKYQELIAEAEESLYLKMSRATIDEEAAKVKSLERELKARRENIRYLKQQHSADVHEHMKGMHGDCTAYTNTADFQVTPNRHAELQKLDKDGVFDRLMAGGEGIVCISVGGWGDFNNGLPMPPADWPTPVSVPGVKGSGWTQCGLECFADGTSAVDRWR